MADINLDLEEKKSGGKRWIWVLVVVLLLAGIATWLALTFDEQRQGPRTSKVVPGMMKDLAETRRATHESLGTGVFAAKTNRPGSGSPS